MKNHRSLALGVALGLFAAGCSQQAEKAATAAKQAESAAKDAAAAAQSAATDAVRDPDDRMPTLVDAAQWAAHFAKHPRSFVKSFVLNR